MRLAIAMVLRSVVVGESLDVGSDTNKYYIIHLLRIFCLHVRALAP